MWYEFLTNDIIEDEELSRLNITTNTALDGQYRMFIPGGSNNETNLITRKIWFKLDKMFGDDKNKQIVFFESQLITKDQNGNTMDDPQLILMINF